MGKNNLEKEFGEMSMFVGQLLICILISIFLLPSLPNNGAFTKSKLHFVER